MIASIAKRRQLTKQAAIAFLHNAARYFESRSTYGEDAAQWANIYNAENCRLIAAMLDNGEEQP